MSVYNRAEPVWFTALLHLEARPGLLEHGLAVHHVCVPGMETEQEALATAGEKLIDRLRSDSFYLFSSEMFKDVFGPPKTSKSYKTKSISYYSYNSDQTAY